MQGIADIFRASALGLVLVHGLAAAQTLGQLPPRDLQPIVYPKYYEAIDLGPVAYGKPVGCLSRNGTVAVTRWRWEKEDNRWHARAIRPGNPEFPFWYVPRFESWVYGCNDNNDFVGVSAGHGGGVVWDDGWNLGPQRLGSSAVGATQAMAINNLRQVVGSSTDSLGNSSAVAWLAPMPVNSTDLTPSVYLAPGEATGINASGVASLTHFVGMTANASTSSRAGLTAVQGGAPFYPILPNASASWAKGIDDQSRIVGGLRDAAGTTRAFTWQMSEGMTTLNPTWDSQGALGHSDARAIGLNRTVVGQSYAMLNGQPVRPAATVWIHSGTARNLNREASMADGSAMPLLTNAVAISHTGAILCEAKDSQGNRRAVLLRPRSGGRWSLIP